MTKINAQFTDLKTMPEGKFLVESSIAILNLIDADDKYTEIRRLPVIDLVADAGVFDAHPFNYDAVCDAIVEGLSDEVARVAAALGLQITDVDGGEQIFWTLAETVLDRSIIQEIQTAATNLGEWLDGAPGGPWHAVRDNPEELGWFVHGEFGVVVTTGYVGNRDSKPTAQMIAGLQRTARVQLGILRRALRLTDEQTFDVWPVSVLDALDLARALNAETE